MRPTVLLTVSAYFTVSTRAWQLARADINGYIQRQRPLGSGSTPHTNNYNYDDDDDIDIVTGSQFHGLKTFAGLPYVNALSDEEAELNPYDIAILGAPFDTSTSGRPGARYGPGGIRIGSQRIFPTATSVYTGENTLDSWAKIVDVGDVGLTWFDNTIALRQLDKAHRVRLKIGRDYTTRNVT